MPTSVKLLLATSILTLLLFGEQPGFTKNQSARAQPSRATENAERFAIPENEKPFWASAQAFLDAYAKRDANAIGELFTQDAEFFDEFGERTEGRENIVAMFQDVFDTSAVASIEEINIQRVRHISPTVAIEEGIVVGSVEAGGPRYTNRYVALHTKGDDGKWRINTLKDHPREGGPRKEQLAQISWILGEWVNQDSDSVVHTNCDWSEDGNYLLRRFTVQTFDGREMNGVQRIGWDPARKKLRSWTFDSEGGFFNGLWTKQGSQWLLTIGGTTAEGKTVTGTAVYRIVDSEMITWQYRNLIVGDEVRSDSEPVTMVRRPPSPDQQAIK